MTFIRKLTRCISMMLVAIAMVAGCFSPMPFAWATSSANNQSNQDMDSPAMLVAPEPDYQIPLYKQPDSLKPTTTYGMGGDQVTILRQVGSNEGITWNYVRLDKDAQTEGWVQEDFIASQPGQESTPQTQAQYQSQDQSQAKSQTSFQSQTAYKPQAQSPSQAQKQSGQAAQSSQSAQSNQSKQTSQSNQSKQTSQSKQSDPSNPSEKPWQQFVKSLQNVGKAQN